MGNVLIFKRFERGGGADFWLGVFICYSTAVGFIGGCGKTVAAPDPAAAASPSPGPFIASDSFNRATFGTTTDALVTGATTSDGASTATYITDGGVFATETSTVVKASTISGTAITFTGLGAPIDVASARIDTGKADCAAQIKVISDNGLFLMFRVQDAQNSWAIAGISGSISLWKVAAGTGNPVGGTIAYDNPISMANRILKVITSGSTIVMQAFESDGITAVGTPVINTSQTSFQTATGFGFAITNTASQLNNFIVNCP
ncbi:hypothetical protein WDW86_02310 [Bdellovibrionota bacterium FG-2]